MDKGLYLYIKGLESHFETKEDYFTRIYALKLMFKNDVSVSDCVRDMKLYAPIDFTFDGVKLSYFTKYLTKDDFKFTNITIGKALLGTVELEHEDSYNFYKMSLPEFKKYLKGFSVKSNVKGMPNYINIYIQHFDDDEDFNYNDDESEGALQFTTKGLYSLYRDKLYTFSELKDRLVRYSLKGNYDMQEFFNNLG